MTDAQPAPTPAEPSRPGLDIERNRMLHDIRHWAEAARAPAPAISR